MRKEIIIAIVVGILFGGVFAFGIRRANVALSPTDEQNPTSPTQQNEEVIENSRSSDGLTILSPEQNDVFTENEVVITGITKPNSTVVVSAEGEDFIISTDVTGEFEQEIELVGGLNHILINSYDNSVEVGSEVLTLVFTTELEI